MHKHKQMHSFVVVLVVRVQGLITLHLLDFVHVFNIAFLKQNRLKTVQHFLDLGIALVRLYLRSLRALLLSFHVGGSGLRASQRMTP